MRNSMLPAMQQERGDVMAFTNSNLVVHKAISPSRTINRNHAIDTITIHCTAGQCSVESLGKLFGDKNRQTSSNYGIGSDGRIGMYCEEKDRSWCSSNSKNDHRAVTIEVSSDAKEPYAVNSAAYRSLIDLVTDICKRNNIKELKWKADKNLIGQVDKQNMTVHRWFANKACPGDYLYSRMGNIASEVNARLNVKTVDVPKNTSATKPFVSYTGRVTCDLLNVREKPSLVSKIKTVVHKDEVYTIVEENGNFGKLKSGAGWVYLKYIKRI